MGLTDDELRQYRNFEFVPTEKILDVMGERLRRSVDEALARGAALAEVERERDRNIDASAIATEQAAKRQALEEENARLRELADALDGLLIIYRTGLTGERAGRAVDRVARARITLLGGGEE